MVFLERLREIGRTESASLLKTMDRCVGQLAEYDTDGQGFRYPLSTTGEQTLTDLRTFDLRNFRDVIARIGNFLDEIQIDLDRRINWESAKS
jgi:hypothetical protein